MSRLLLISLLVLISSKGFAQPFNPDACGVVKDTSFQKFCKKKGYVLVGTFRCDDYSYQKYAAVFTGSEWKRIDLDGKEHAIPSYENVEICGTAMIENWKKQKHVCEPWPDYWGIDNPSETGIVSKNGKVGYIYLKKAILPAVYDSIERVDQNGLFFLKVSSNGKYGIADYRGKWVVPMKYDAIHSISNSFICKNNQLSSILLNTGKAIIDSVKSDITGVGAGVFTWKDVAGVIYAVDCYGSHCILPTERTYPDQGLLSDPDEPAQFPGGSAAMYKFIQSNLRYPPMECIWGRVYLNFVVGIDGKISNVQVQRGIADCPECSKEAIRVVSIMPDWIPGKTFGRPVASYFNLPIKFEMTQ